MDGLDSSAVTDDDIAAIKSGLATIMDGVTASHITGVAVTDVSSRRLTSESPALYRRRLASSSARSLLGTAASVSFTVTVSGATNLLGTVSSSLAEAESDSSTLVAEIKAAASSPSKWDAVTGISAATAYVVSKPPTAMPSAAPVPIPSAAPTTTADDGEDGSPEEALAASVLYGLIAVAVAVIGAMGAAANYRLIKSKREQRQGKHRVKVEQNEPFSSELKEEPVPPAGPRSDRLQDRGRSVDLYSLPAHEVELITLSKATPLQPALPERSVFSR